MTQAAGFCYLKGIRLLRDARRVKPEGSIVSYFFRFFAIIVVLGFSSTIGSYAANRPSFDYRVIPYDHYEEGKGLPPTLKVTFQLKCFQRFEKVIRHDDTAAAGKVTIAVGILVYENLNTPCESAKNVTVDAGNTFSGREYSVVPIGAAKPND